MISEKMCRFLSLAEAVMCFSQTILKEQLLVDKKSNVDTVLQVFKENPAKKLYEKVGFEVYDETDTHYKMIKKIKEES